MIYHIASENEWNACEGRDEYAPARFEEEGFIHSSTDQQVQKVANRIFKDHHEVWLLCIDDEAEKAFIVYENLEGGSEQFPHIYRRLPKSSIIKKVRWKKSEQGFVFPSEV